MNVYAFDVDGTLETSDGPVSIFTLAGLRGMRHYVYIVSPSDKRPRGFPVVLVGDRIANLTAVKAMHPDADRFVYVSDNNDQADAQAAGFEFIHPSDFGRAG